MSEDQLDLEIDLSFLLEWWREIVLLTIVCVVVAGVVTQVLPEVYEAQSQVLILRRRSAVDLASNVSIETEGDALTSAGPGTATYADLVTSPAVAERALELLDSSWRGGVEEPADLLGSVEAESRTGSDLLLIKVRDEDPARASAVATAWSEAYVAHVNQLYNEASADYGVVVAQLGQQQTEYEVAQAALEDFVQDEKIDELETSVLERTALINRLRVDKQTALSALHDSAWHGSITASLVDVVASGHVFDSGVLQCISVPTDLTLTQSSVTRSVCQPPVSMALVQRFSALSADYALLQQYRRQLDDVQVLRANLAQGGDPASTALSIALIKTQLLDVDRGLPAELSVQLPDAQYIDIAVQQADLAAIEAVLGEAITDLDVRIAEATRDLEGVSYGLDVIDQTDDPLNQQLTTLHAEVQSLASQIERQRAEKRKLELARDLAWESYSTLARKEAELRVANELPASDVRFAAPATVPRQPVSPRTMLIVAGAGSAGLVLAVSGAFLLNHLDREPFFSKGRSMPRT